MKDGHETVGKAMLCLYEVMPDERNLSGKWATLFSVYTRPAYRGKGYMEQLLIYLFQEARLRGVAQVLASAEEKAIPLYQRLGFTMQKNWMSRRL